MAKKKIGRPLISIDGKQVEALASVGCCAAEIGAVLGCAKTTLNRRFGPAIKRGHENQRASLRKMQWNAAKSGNATMQIWLGKQYLGQRDKVAQEVEMNVSSTAKILEDGDWYGNKAAVDQVTATDGAPDAGAT